MKKNIFVEEFSVLLKRKHSPGSGVCSKTGIRKNNTVKRRKRSLRLRGSTWRAMLVAPTYSNIAIAVKGSMYLHICVRFRRSSSQVLPCRAHSSNGLQVDVGFWLDVGFSPLLTKWFGLRTSVLRFREYNTSYEMV